MTLKKTLDLVRGFREGDKATPLVLMGYYNPVYIYGVERFIDDAIKAGVDGLIMVDMPPEEDAELCLPAIKKGLAFIRLATPTTDDARLPKVLSNSTGFVYYVSITGITGTASADTKNIEQAVTRLKRATKMPVAVGFGINTPEQAATVARVADAAVVGTAVVKIIGDHLKHPTETVAKTHRFIADLPPACEAHGSTHELAHQLRPPEAAGAGQARHARQPLAQVPGLRADDLSPRPGGEAPCLRQVRPSSPPARPQAPRHAVR